MKLDRKVENVPKNTENENKNARDLFLSLFPDQNQETIGEKTKEGCESYGVSVSQTSECKRKRYYTKSKEIQPNSCLLLHLFPRLH